MRHRENPLHHLHLLLPRYTGCVKKNGDPQKIQKITMTYIYYANIFIEVLYNVSKHSCEILFRNMNRLNFYRRKPKFHYGKTNENREILVKTQLWHQFSA